MRQAAQLHRLEAGLWRLGACPWIGTALQTIHTKQELPVRFRHPSAWLTLLRAHTVDLAVVSGLDLDLVLPDPLPSTEGIQAWEECVLLPIGQTSLGLLCPPAQTSLPARWGVVAVPSENMAPGIASRVRQDKWRCLYAPKNHQEPATWAGWLQGVEVAVAASPTWARELKHHLTDWQWQPWPKPLQQTLWLLALRTVWSDYEQLHALSERIRRSLQSCNSESESALPKTRGQLNL
jgi:hypothetical protein